MVGLPYTDIDYCCHCDWGYRKKTRLWNNIGFEGDQCKGKGACPNMDGNKHKSTTQQGKINARKVCMAIRSQLINCIGYLLPYVVLSNSPVKIQYSLKPKVT